MTKWHIVLALLLIATATLSAAPQQALGVSTSSSSSPLMLSPHPVLLRADDNSKTTTTVYTTDPVAFLNAALPRLPEPNKSIVEILLSYPRNGEHTYWWPKGGSYDGCTTDVVIAGKTVMKGEPQGRTFCCGLTLEVFYRYAAQKPQVAAKLATTDSKFKQDWFCRKLNSPGPLDALMGASIGKQITDPEQALPGDFVQLWRNDKSGHSVIFINWLRDASGQRVGLQYWSTQTGTNGIGFSSEAFGSAKKQINPSHFSITRPTI